MAIRLFKEALGIKGARRGSHSSQDRKRKQR
jgi:hypothetical protein